MSLQEHYQEMVASHQRPKREPPRHDPEEARSDEDNPDEDNPDEEFRVRGGAEVTAGTSPHDSGEASTHEDNPHEHNPAVEVRGGGNAECGAGTQEASTFPQETCDRGLEEVDSLGATMGSVVVHAVQITSPTLEAQPDTSGGQVHVPGDEKKPKRKRPQPKKTIPEQGMESPTTKASRITRSASTK